jgi:hypothetical protein
MVTRKTSEGDDPVAAALQAAVDAGERFAQAKSELEHRLADIDGALVEMVQRVYDATPAEYQRTFRVREGGDDDELPLPEFVRYLMERPRGTTAAFTIQVVENLYDVDGDDEEPDISGFLDDDAA